MVRRILTQQQRSFEIINIKKEVLFYFFHIHLYTVYSDVFI